jgi:hypothetical protein
LLRLLDEDSAGSSAAAADPGSPVAGSSTGAVSGASSISSKNHNGIGVGFAGGNDEDEDARPLSPSGTKLVPLQRLTDDLRRLRVSLSPLRSIEESLVRIISPDAPRYLGGGGAGGGGRSTALPTERAFEVGVRSGSRWKALFKGGAGAAGAAAMSKMSARGYEELSDARRVIEACREDIVALWNHPAVRANLAEQSVALEFQSGLYVYFLNSSGTLPGLRLPTLFSVSPFRSTSFFSLLTFSLLFFNIKCTLRVRILFDLLTSFFCSFLDAVDRIAAPGYQPSPGEKCQILNLHTPMLTPPILNALS